ncbi:MAG: 4Fe-4S binding protein [Bacteroidetes bacterium]|jgi:Pyruvate/2-oxoacid:ferredoxin oxidoreductase delta subunit|nr:4Fe-4S binding protein [Bacteroidota bacterium]
MADWDSLYIYYFSGTGNARTSAQWIAEEAIKKGLRTDVQSIDRLTGITFPDTNKKNLIGFVFPTHGFNAPPIMLKFIAGFPAGLCPEIFLVNTRGGLKLSKIFTPGMTGLALIVPALMLWLKGYKCIGFRPVDMPSNWISLHPGLKRSVIVSIFNRCEGIVRRFANRILSGHRVYRGLFSLPADLLISPVSLAYYLGGRFFLSKTFVANDKCSNCGICINECPTSSIIMVNGRPYWKLTCESCMRCLNNCPERAIETAHGMATFFIIFINAVNIHLLLLITEATGISPSALWWEIISQFISIAVMVAGVTLLYKILHYMMGFKPFQYLIRFTSLTTWPFWRRYKYVKEKEKEKSNKKTQTRVPVRNLLR